MHEINLATNALHDIFDAINEKYYDCQLEIPVITIQSNEKHKNAYGWATVERVWESKDGNTKKFEVNVCAEYLSRSIIDIACTTAHECVHIWCGQNGIKETSNKNIYHNKKYKSEAEARGLIISEAKTIGHSVTSASPEFEEFINSLNIPEESFSMYRVSRTVLKDGKEKTKKPRKPKVEWTCSCGIVIKSKKDDLNVICGDCNQKFAKKVTEGLDGEDDGE